MSAWQPGDPLYLHPDDDRQTNADRQTVRLMAYPHDDHPPDKCLPGVSGDMCVFAEDAARWPEPYPWHDLEGWPWI